MTTRCPTCAQPLGGALTDRLLVYLAKTAPRPIQARELAKELKAQRTTVYQTLRRLCDRGSIRRASIQGVGQGWILTPQAPVLAAYAPADGVDRMAGYMEVVQELAVDGGGYVARGTVVAMLSAEGLDGEEVEDLIAAMVEGGMLIDEGARLVLP